MSGDLLRHPAEAVLSRFHRPTQVVAGGFGLAVLIGTGLLALPVAGATGEPAHWLDALFTATSAVCLTGLTVVDTAGHWSVFGEVVIMLLIQAGGLGIMTLATVFTLLVAGRIGLRARLLTQAETKMFGVADLRRVVRNVVLFSLASELVVAAVLTARFGLGYDEPPGRALYLGVFHAVSAFNNAGFALWPDSLARFTTDAWISLTIAGAVLVGGTGFPVLFELWRSWRHPSRWSVLTRVTLGMSLPLLLIGTFVYTLAEWNNPATFGPLDDGEKFLAGFFAAVMPRSGGFTTVDIGRMDPSSWLATDVLMFIGGGSAGTAGGIKVTTLGLLAFAIWAELRGEPQVAIGHRRVPETAQRQAISIAVLGAGLVTAVTYVLLLLTPFSLDQVVFEAISAFATNGLSTGITAELPPAARLLLVALMFVGRIGPLTLGSALALRERTRRYELPEERVIVG